MKKLLSVFLALLFFIQALPLNAAAAALNPPPTAQELSAAVALTGLADDAPSYRSGMAPSKSMTALQMAGWIREFRDMKLAYIMDTFENYDVELAYLKDHYPATFGMLKSFSGAGIGKLYDEYSRARDWRDEVEYYADQLDSTASQIYMLADSLQNSGELTEQERVVNAYRMRDKWRALNALLADTVTLAGQWEREYDRLNTLLTGEYAYSGSTESLAWLLEQVDSLREMDTGRASRRTMTVSADAVRVAPDQTVMTRLARLSPIGSALADADQQMSVMVLDDKSFAVGAMDGTTPMAGVSITVTAEGVKDETKTTDKSGYIALPMRNYPSSKDGEAKISVKASMDGYRRVEAPNVWVMKGGDVKVPMFKDNGDPYPVSFTFWGNDMMLADYELALHPFNDSKQEIAVRISSAKAYSIKVYFTDKDGNNRLDVGSGSGGAGEKNFAFSGMWLKKAPGDGKLFLDITPAGGDTVTYQAHITLIAPKVPKPIGDPNFKLLMSPGISFTLPSGWAKPLGGLNINIEIPFAKDFKIRAYVDPKGSGAITVGTTAFDDKVKEMNEGAWKSKDSRQLDRDVKAAEEKGMYAKAKAANGGDWDGRSKLKQPFKLGNVKVSMSWFGFIQGQVRKENGDIELRGKGGAGFTLSVTGEAGLMWPLFKICLVPYASATIFPDVTFIADLYWEEGSMPQVKRSKYVLGSFNFILRIELALTACVGLSGFASVSFTGLGFLEFHFRARVGKYIDEDHEKLGEGDGDVEAKLYGGAAFRIIVEFLIAKATYTPFGPEWKWRLLPGPIERVDGSSAPKTMVERFVAFLVSSASAEEDEGEPEGGMQVDIQNKDLILKPTNIRYQDQGASKNALFTMRPSGAGSADPVPMMLYLKNKRDNGGNLQFSRPVLMAVNLTGNQLESPIAKTDKGLNANGEGIFTDGGWDVIDYSYWVQDVTGVNASSYDRGTEKKLTDILFVATVLANEYEQQSRTLSDGTRETRTVPVQTWVSVRSYYLASTDFGYKLRPVVLSPGGKYLSEQFRTDYNDYYRNPCANPRIYGNLQLVKGSISTLFRVVASPLNIDTRDNRSADCFEIFGAIQEDGFAFRLGDRMDRTDSFFGGKAYDEFLFFDRLDHSWVYGLNPNKGQVREATAYYTLVRDAANAEGLYSLGFEIGSGGTIVYADNVFSFAPRNAAGSIEQMVFMVKQNEEGDGFTLCGLNQRTENKNNTRLWTTWDYGVSVPAVNIRTANLYGRECVYWEETGGETDDGDPLFTVRGVWYDGSSNTMSEPFTLATIKTEAGKLPSQIILSGNDSGYYILDQDDGRETVHRFDFKLVLGVKLVGNLLSETLATPGSYDDMLLTVYNNGNVPMAGLDLTAYDVKNGGKPQAFETIHLDVLNPANNRVVLSKDLEGGTENRQGVTVARQEDSSLNDPNAGFWLVKETSYRTRMGNVTGETSALLKTNLIMPGMFSAFNISLLMPQSWSDTHDIYLQVEKIYTTDDSVFSNDANEPLLQGMGRPAMISVSRDGAVRKEGGGLLLGAAADDTDYSAMFKTDLTFDRISLAHDTMDLEIQARRWTASDGTPMVTLTVNNQAYVDDGNSGENVVVMEAFLDDETKPVFRYSMPWEVSDKETWNFDLPLSLLTGGRSAAKVTVKVGGKNYTENGEFDNSAILYLEPDDLVFRVQPESRQVPDGAAVVFHAEAAGGRTPYQYQWQVKTPNGAWTDIKGETSAALTLDPVTPEMNGNRYRLRITDESGASAVSAEAALTVKQMPRTGDTAPLFLYAAGIAAAMGVIAFIVFRRKKENG